MLNKRNTTALFLVVAIAVTLSACSPTSPRAQEAYDTCSDSETDDLGLVQIEGSTVLVAIEGKYARAYSNFDSEIDDLMSEMDEGTASSQERDEGEVSGFKVGLTMLASIDCLIEQTEYPGTSDDLTDGEEWDGWEYEYEDGAGSSETYRFTARE